MRSAWWRSSKSHHKARAIHRVHIVAFKIARHGLKDSQSASQSVSHRLNGAKDMPSESQRKETKEQEKRNERVNCWWRKICFYFPLDIQTSLRMHSYRCFCFGIQNINTNRNNEKIIINYVYTDINKFETRQRKKIVNVKCVKCEFSFVEVELRLQKRFQGNP